LTFWFFLVKESNLKRLLLIFSGFLPRPLKGEVAENQLPFRDGAKLIFSGCEKCVFLDWTRQAKRTERRDSSLRLPSEFRMTQDAN